MSDIGTNRQILIDYMLTSLAGSAIFLMGIYLQPIGLFISIFSPIPIILAYLQKGRNNAILTMLIVFSIVSLAGNVKYGLIYLLEYGIMAAVMGETIRRGFSIEKTITCALIAILVTSSVFLFMYASLKNVDIQSFLTAEVKKQIEEGLAAYKEAEKKGGYTGLIDTKELYNNMVSMFTISFPAWITISIIIGAFGNYIITKQIAIKYHMEGERYFTASSLYLWKLPDHLIWLFITAAIMVIYTEGIYYNAGLNILIVLSILYLFQGISITGFYMSKINIPVFLKMLIYTFALTQPFIISFIVVIGLFDLWIDFRKFIKNDKEEKKKIVDSNNHL